MPRDGGRQGGRKKEDVLAGRWEGSGKGRIEKGELATRVRKQGSQNQERCMLPYLEMISQFFTPLSKKFEGREKGRLAGGRGHQRWEGWRARS